MIASSDSIESATETNSRIRLTNGGESPPANNPSKTAIANITGVFRTALYSFMTTRGLRPTP